MICTRGCSDGLLTRMGGGGAQWCCSCAEGRAISREQDDRNRRHREYWDSPLDPAARNKAEQAVTLFKRADGIVERASLCAEEIRTRGRDLINTPEEHRAWCRLTDKGQG